MILPKPILQHHVLYSGAFPAWYKAEVEEALRLKDLESRVEKLEAKLSDLTEEP